MVMGRNLFCSVMFSAISLTLISTPWQGKLPPTKAHRNNCLKLSENMEGRPEIFWTSLKSRSRMKSGLLSTAALIWARSFQSQPISKKRRVMHWSQSIPKSTMPAFWNARHTKAKSLLRTSPIYFSTRRSMNLRTARWIHSKYSARLLLLDQLLALCSKVGDICIYTTLANQHLWRRCSKFQIEST